MSAPGRQTRLGVQLRMENTNNVAHVATLVERGRSGGTAKGQMHRSETRVAATGSDR